MLETVRWSEVNEILQVLFPASYNSAQAGARIKATGHSKYVVLGLVGLIATNGTLDLKVEQHNAASSGTTKALNNAVAITQLIDSNDNKFLILEFKTSNLDIDNGFKWFSVTLTPATAASLAALVVLGVDPKYYPVATTNVHQIVNK